MTAHAPAPDSTFACTSNHCVTCGDDGTPMTVLRVDEARNLALCEGEDGGRATVEIALLAPPILPGQSLLVHAGTAIARLQTEPTAAR